jgi:hypothetical protein
VTSSTDATASLKSRALPLTLRVIRSPRAAMRWILAHQPRKGVLPLVLLAGVSIALPDLAQAVASRSRIAALAESAGIDGTAASVGLFIVVGLLWIAAVFAMFYLLSWMATLSGRFVGGRGSAAAVRAAMAWGASPIIWALLYRVPAAIFWSDSYLLMNSRNDVFVVGERSRGGLNFEWTALPEVPLYQMVVLFALDMAVICLYLLVASRTLAEAQGISSWQGLGNLLLAFILPVAALFALFLAIALAAA